MNAGEEEKARLLWDYLRLNDRVIKSEAAIVHGSQDLRLARWGAGLWLDKWVPVLVMSGGIGRLTNIGWGMTEAEIFAGEALQSGVPEGAILIENKSTNTDTNVTLSRQMLERAEIPCRQLIAVCQPYMERRTSKYYQKNWPDIKVVFSGPPITFEEYPGEFVPEDEMVSIMVGEVERLIKYPQMGFISPEAIPDNVLKTAEELAQKYSRYLVKPSF